MKIGVEIISNTIYKMVRTNKLGIVATLVAAAVAFSSCTKDEKADGLKISASGKTINFSSLIGGNNLSTKGVSNEAASVTEHYEIAAEIANIQGSKFAGEELFTVEVMPNDGSFYGSYDAATKTVYGADKEESGQKYSSILWESGDVISILSDQAKVGSFNSNRTDASSDPNQLNSNKADYSIESVSQKSSDKAWEWRGTIVPVKQGNGLWWGDSSKDHYFFGSYPKMVAYTPDLTNKKVTLTGLNYSVKGSDGFTQDVVLDGSIANQYNPNLKEQGYMYAGLKVLAANVPAKEVDMKFEPNFTAYEVNLTNDKLTGDGESMILKRVTIESAQDIAAEGVSTILQFDGSDNFEFSNDLSVITEPTSKSKKITINFKKSDGTDALPITLPTGGNYLKFTILTLGKTSSGYQTDVKIKFEMEYNENKVGVSGTDKIHRIMTLTLKKGTNNMRVPEGKKVVIKNGKMTTGFSTLSTNVDAIVVAKSKDVNGYCRDTLRIISKSRTDGTILEPWEIFALVNGSEVAYGAADWPEWIRLDKNKSATKPKDSVIITTNPGALDRATATITSPAAGFITELKNATPIGSESTPRDLSKYDIYGVEYGSATSKVTSITTSGSHTANCYVVSAPGYYSFPLVYGNAVGYTATNSDYAALKKTYTGYKNANNKDISSPYILTDLSITEANDLEAVVVWQDVYPGADVILDKDISVVDAPSGAGLTCKYIQFRIQQENILPCNAIIALRKKSTEKILWSWHIWVAPITSTGTTSTDYYKWNDIYDFKYFSISDAEISAKMLNSNLGWCPPIKYSGNTEARSMTLRIRHTGTEDTYKDVTITQESYSVNSEGEFFSSVFYQWGRKDPLVGYQGETIGKIDKPFSSIKGYEIYAPNESSDLAGSTLRLNKLGFGILATSIQNPHLNNGANYTSINIINLWNSLQTSYTTRGTWYDYTAKTIFDPSPAGFCVPPTRFGNAFTSTTAGKKHYGSDIYGTLTSYDASKGIPDGMLFSNTRSASDYNLFFPIYYQRRAGGGRVHPATDNLVRYWASSSYKNSTSFCATVLACNFDEAEFNIFPANDSNVSQNQGNPLRPILEQSSE